MAKCGQRLIDEIRKLAHQANKEGSKGPNKCIASFNDAIETARREVPLGASFSCDQLIGTLKKVATAYDRGLECAKPAVQKTWVEVEASAKQSSGRVSLFTYICDDLSLPLAVTNHRDLASAQRAAKEDREYCHVITGHGHTPGE